MDDKSVNEEANSDICSSRWLVVAVTDEVDVEVDVEVAVEVDVEDETFNSSKALDSSLKVIALKSRAGVIVDSLCSSSCSISCSISCSSCEFGTDGPNLSSSSSSSS